MDGRPARSTEDGQLGSPTVVIQYVRVTKSGFFEHGRPPPYAQTVGSGRAVVLRDGKSWQVRWSRATASAGTTFTLPDGAPMPFAHGQVWVLLAFGHGSTWHR